MDKKNNFIRKFIKIRGMNKVLVVTFGLILLCVSFGIINPTFYSSRNISNLLRQIAPILIIGFGQSFVLITGNIDLSIGSVVGMSCMISATLMTKGMSPILATLLTIIICVLTGMINGVLVAGIKIPPFIATLGTMTVARGIAQIVNNNYNTDTIGKLAQGFRNVFYYGKFLGVYNAFWIAIIMFIVLDILLIKTKLGRHMYAIGSNAQASKFSGVNILKTTVIAYIISAFCSGIVGMMMTATSGIGTMDSGTMYEMYAVAASVIGGVSTLGGEGLLIGTVIGASIWGVLQNGLQFAGAPVAIRNIVIGIIVVASVMLDVIIRRGRALKIFK